ncbi:Uncharacterised protein [Mycobacteroides abscessus subsp. massiliense]|uniref:hypothetical protein n=1 Tax=Mycobacteroides abscessus TaxID=36809 RepID=UPI0009A69B81|nr:hypothetical protein [Mycobacteroides abscessus]SKM82223.1 Uncharacterised protein [Mycobacteroides abscessus subsp. massiliense]SKM98934.1 Uncharacterised protein [Mycobacteroides abscessus subsp. massiliense]SKN77526.1 Uncharacterised protein [Mycobacteroides abscessus subsp. massiliense]SKN95667.1 Uncharacterised protein [Mycobacteroides abscessus subsp. massiliense]SKO22791.1 Uncharacterised protein [Mycobacteroides abscessus subsp. massiliense]
MADFTDLFPGANRNTLNYRGDIADHIMRDTHPFGPDMFGAYYVPVAATYLPDSDITRVSFRTIPPKQTPPANQPRQAVHLGPNRRQRRKHRR